MLNRMKLFTRNISNLKNIKNKTNKLGWLIIAIFILVVVAKIIEISKMRSSKCSSIQLSFTDPNIISIAVNQKDFQNPLYDYYIKSAYNCCAISKFSNSYVDLCALDNVIKSGVRFLDFEIYSMGGYKPVVGVSNLNTNNVKESYNQLELSSVLENINRNAFTSAIGCKNPDDPVFLHFRVKSNHKEVYNNIAKAITNTFDVEDQLLGKDFSNAFNGYNLGKIPLHTLSKNGKFGDITNRKAKVVIIVDSSNKTYLDTDLKELVNMESGSNFMNLKQTFNIKTDQNKKALIENNKHNITVVTPDRIPEGGDTSSLQCCVPGSQNPDFKTSYEVGCQIVCMCFQNNDTNLKNYNKFFHSNGTAFVLKPESLRYKQVCIDKPIKQKKSNSFATRTVSDDYYSFNI